MPKKEHKKEMKKSGMEELTSFAIMESTLTVYRSSKRPSYT